MTPLAERWKQCGKSRYQRFLTLGQHTKAIQKPEPVIFTETTANAYVSTILDTLPSAENGRCNLSFIPPLPSPKFRLSIWPGGQRPYNVPAVEHTKGTQSARCRPMGFGIPLPSPKFRLKMHNSAVCPSRGKRSLTKTDRQGSVQITEERAKGSKQNRRVQNKTDTVTKYHANRFSCCSVNKT